MTHQFILDENNKPLFAIIPYLEYRRNFNLSKPEASDAMTGPVPLSIPLPNGGAGAAINLPALVDYWARRGILAMPISQRAKPLDAFEHREWFSVEALVRVCFVPEGYRNTMQVVSDVTAKLVASGIFREVRFDIAQMKDGQPFIRCHALIPEESKTFNFERYSRSVKFLEIVEENAVSFLEKYPVKESERIQDSWWVNTNFCV